jgi:hypothetical protein
MAKLTLSEAARACNVARTTIQRAVKTGRISLDAEHRVDTAELLRIGYQLDAAERSTPAQHLTAAGCSSPGTPAVTPGKRRITAGEGPAHAAGEHAAHDTPNDAAAADASAADAARDAAPL